MSVGAGVVAVRASYVAEQPATVDNLACLASSRRPHFTICKRRFQFGTAVIDHPDGSS